MTRWIYSLLSRVPWRRKRGRGPDSPSSAIAGLCAGVALVFCWPGKGTGDDYRPGTPFAYLFDTGSVAPAPLSGDDLRAKTGWTLLPEEDLAHAFEGDPVLLNDKLTVVLRAKGPGAEVYSETALGPTCRAVLMCVPWEAAGVTGLASARILENNPGAVMVEATWTTAGGAGRSRVRYRLTTGERTVEMWAGESADRLFVVCRTRYVVVPDFFADDMVFGRDALGRPRFGLPAENFLLNLIRGQSAMVMCVWESSRQSAYAHLTGEGPQPVIGGCEIQGVQGKSLWVAFLEGPNIWHERAISADDANREILLDWKPPFAAKWRADLAGPDGVAASSYFTSTEESDGISDAADDERCQCRLDGDRALVQLQQTTEHDPLAGRSPTALLVYPLDRSRATPLTAFCPVDVIRNTLGVGPCQYVLQTEGLASETNPTPEGVMDWVESRFEKDKQAESADEIRELLGQMVDHVGHAQARVRQYAAFAWDVREVCGGDRQEDVSGVAETLGSILDDLEQATAAAQGAEEPARRAAVLADGIVGLIGRDNPLAECRRLGAELRRIGAVQERTLSKCRMTVRWLKQQSRAVAVSHPQSVELAKEVWTRAERILEHK